MEWGGEEVWFSIALTWFGVKWDFILHDVWLGPFLTSIGIFVFAFNSGKEAKGN